MRVVYAIGELWTAAVADLEGQWIRLKEDKAEDMELDIVQRKIFCVQGAARNWGEVTAKPRSDAALLDDAGKLRIILHNMRVKMADVEELLRKQGSQTALPAKQRAANEQVLKEIAQKETEARDARREASEADILTDTEDDPLWPS